MILGHHTFFNEHTQQAEHVEDFPQVFQITPDKFKADELKQVFADNQPWVVKKRVSESALLSLLQENPYSYNAKEFTRL